MKTMQGEGRYSSHTSDTAGHHVHRNHHKTIILFFIFDWIRFHTEKARERRTTKPKTHQQTLETQKQQHADTKRALSLI